MFEFNPNIFVTAFFLLIIVTLSCFGLVLIRQGGETSPSTTVRYYFLYFSAGILFWLALWMKESLSIAMGYSSALVLYLLASMFLLLAVSSNTLKPRSAKGIIAIHLLMILGAVFVQTIQHYLLVEAVYTLVIYPIIGILALKWAYRNRGMGGGLIAVAAILTFVVSPIQLYGILFAESVSLIYAASIILQSIAFVLIGIGLMRSVMNSTQKPQGDLELRDPLTGLYTQRGMVHAIEIPLALLRRSEGYIAAISIDIDGFKQINDSHGSDAGNLVLVEVAKALRVNTRDSDLACRIEADHFMVLLPGESEYTELVAERLRKAIENTIIPSDDVDIHCTASLGVASQFANKDFDYLLSSADKALKRAKSEGKNLISREH